MQAIPFLRYVTQSMATRTQDNPGTSKEVIQVESATVRFAGDSGDGMQLAGTQLTNTSALAGNDVATFPDFPAEIRAPRGTENQSLFLKSE